MPTRVDILKTNATVVRSEPRMFRYVYQVLVDGRVEKYSTVMPDVLSARYALAHHYGIEPDMVGPFRKSDDPR